jgi:hypothetical protein
LKNPITKNWDGGVTQGEGLEFKPQYRKTTTTTTTTTTTKPQQTRISGRHNFWAQR